MAACALCQVEVIKAVVSFSLGGKERKEISRKEQPQGSNKEMCLSRTNKRNFFLKSAMKVDTLKCKSLQVAAVVGLHSQLGSDDFPHFLGVTPPKFAATSVKLTVNVQL